MILFGKSKTQENKYSGVERIGSTCSFQRKSSKLICTQEYVSGMNTTRPWSLMTLRPPRFLLAKVLCCRGRTPRLRKWSSGREIQPHKLLISFKKLLNSLSRESLSRMMIEMRIRKIRERTLSLFSRRLLRRRLSKILRLSEGVEKAHWSSHTFTLRMDLYDFHQQGVSRHFDYTIIYLSVYYVFLVNNYG